MKIPAFKKYLSTEDLRSLSGAIAETEKHTNGEIRVVVRHRRSWKERKLTLHQLAVYEFYRLGMQKTRDRTGVLIMLLLSERSFQIIGDEGIHAKVGDETWEKIAAEMSAYFKDGKFSHGLTQAIRAVGTILARHFPRTPGQTNELSNDIIES